MASLISVPLQGNWDFGIGDNDETATLLNIQPVIPFPVSKSTNVILRVIMPMTSQPGSGDARAQRHGRHRRERVLLAVEDREGHLGRRPRRAAAHGDGQRARQREVRRSVPTVVVLTQPGKWTLGALFNQIWSTSGAKNRTDVNTTFLQPFANYNLGGGLSVGVSMEATGNWNADEAWTAPLLFNVSKVTLLGKRPVSLAVAAGPMVASPAGGASWRFRLVATFLYPRG